MHTFPFEHPVSLFLSPMALFHKSGNAGFEELVARPPKLPLTSTIPKIAHFVITEVDEFDWLNYAIVRSAMDWWGAEKVDIWVPMGERLPGPMWERVLRMQNVTARAMHLPNIVWGKTVNKTQHLADVAKIKVLYEEGGESLLPKLRTPTDQGLGICMNSDLMALKSSDDVIHDPTTRSAILPRMNEGLGGHVVNSMIMAKAQSPFLQRWMKRYRSFDPGEWDTTSGIAPKEMYYAGDPDLTLLHSSAWLYPEDHLREHGSWDSRQPYLTKMWTGKSWHDIDRSYGLTFWAFEAEGGSKRPFGVDLSPDVVRNIDTPLFCRMRKLFDNADGDGYLSTPWEKDPNCTVSWMKDLEEDTHRLFAEYHFRDDTSDMKWVDTSGHRNHGWAFNTTINATDTKAVKRRIASGSHAFLPVPADWDSRVGTVRMAFQPDTSILSDRSNNKAIGLLKIRMDYSGEILFSLASDAIGLPQFKFQWLGNIVGIKGDYERIEDTSWTSADGWVFPISPFPSPCYIDRG